MEVQASVTEPQVECKDASDQPLYGDTKRSNEYTSESYKVELINLPGHQSFQIIKNLLEKRFKVKPLKIRLGQNKAFLAFKGEKERDDAISKIHNQDWKGRMLVAQIATARDDPLAKKRKLTDKPVVSDPDEEIREESITDADINLRVCPLWDKSYDDQLKIKDSMVRSVLNMSRQIFKMTPNLKNDAPKLYEWIRKNDKICCKYDGIIGSPVVTGYRNKCEFNISREGDIGFKIGRYRGGSDRICRPPDNCPLLTTTMFQIIDLFANYLKTNSRLKGFDMVTHEGHYRQMTVRCNSKNEYLLVIDLNPQSLTEVELTLEIEQALELFKPINQVITIYFNISEKCAFSSSNQSLRLAYGEGCLFEELNVNPERPLRFRIGPGSFFQVNTKAAEILYRAIIEVAQLSSNSMVLDVGCGTGTIGLSLASHVNHVVGIDIVPAAIQDAKSNATANGIENVSFYAGKAEDLIGESITILKNKLEYQRVDGAIVAIVDPPRVGFNNSFIKLIRASNIKKIVYIACDPKANSNLVALCRPKSKAYQGEPFVPTRAKAFDLFPHTRCCELMIVYERLSSIQDDK